MEILEYPTIAQRNAVYRLVQQALAQRTLLRATACQWCGATPGVRALHGHHPDYNRPLMVVWLCASCHRSHHAHYDVERLLHGSL